MCISFKKLKLPSSGASIVSLMRFSLILSIKSLCVLLLSNEDSDSVVTSGVFKLKGVFIMVVDVTE